MTLSSKAVSEGPQYCARVSGDPTNGAYPGCERSGPAYIGR